MKEKTVHVIAWEYDGGGGFCWYRNESDMLAELPRELEYEKVYSSDNWRVKNFPVNVPLDRDPTDFIDQYITELFDNNGCLA